MIYSSFFRYQILRQPTLFIHLSRDLWQLLKKPQHYTTSSMEMGKDNLFCTESNHTADINTDMGENGCKCL